MSKLHVMHSTSNSILPFEIEFIDLGLYQFSLEASRRFQGANSS